jgi:hypothetical protein
VLSPELFVTLVAQRAVQAFSIVKDLDELEDVGPGLLAGLLKVGLLKVTRMLCLDPQ